MAAHAAVDSSSGPAAAHSETRRPRKYSLSPSTAIRLTSAARASSLSTRNSLWAPRPGATASVPSGRSLTPPPRSPPRARPSRPGPPARSTSPATPPRTLRARASWPPRRPRPQRLPCARGARRTPCARRRNTSPYLLLLGPDDPDDGRARHDEHLAPTPLVVHQVRVDGGVPRLGGPDVAVVLQGVFLAHAGREHLVVLDRAHQMTPTSLSCFRPRGVMSLLDQVGQTTSISTSSMRSISSNRSRTSSWIMSIAGHPMHVYVNLMSALLPLTSIPLISPRSTRLIGYSGSKTSRSASLTSSSVLVCVVSPSTILPRGRRVPFIRPSDTRRTPPYYFLYPSIPLLRHHRR